MAVQTKLQVRRDTAANWTTANATLAAGEIGFETDTQKFKIGTGSTAWTSLGYQAAVFNGGTITNALVVSNTGGVNTSGQFISTIATSNAPFIVSSTTQVANLNVATSGSVNATVTGTNSANLVYGSMGDNDQFRIQIGATATNNGFVEIATADDGTEPIHVRQYTGVFTTLARTATLLDGSGNTTFPGTVSGTRFISNVSVGTAPFTVTSTTQVANLNVAISGSTSNVLGGAAGSLPYQSAANTTTFLAATATNGGVLAYNTGTNAPFWQTITGTGSIAYATSPTISSPSITTSITTTSTGTFTLLGNTMSTMNFAAGAAITAIGKVGGLVNIKGETSIEFSGLSIGYGSSGWLDVNGAITGAAITGSGTVTGGNLTTAGSITRTTLVGGGTTGASFSNTGTIIRTTSSQRYKQDIQDAYYVYEDILSLSPKTFRFKEEVEINPESRVYAGLIAEDVDQIESLKVFVNYQTQEDNSKIPDGIAYGEMVSALVAAIKHQDTVIKNLEARVEQLEA